MRTHRVEFVAAGWVVADEALRHAAAADRQRMPPAQPTRICRDDLATAAAQIDHHHRPTPRHAKRRAQVGQLRLAFARDDLQVDAGRLAYAIHKLRAVACVANRTGGDADDLLYPERARQADVAADGLHRRIYPACVEFAGPLDAHAKAGERAEIQHRLQAVPAWPCGDQTDRVRSHVECGDRCVVRGHWSWPVCWVATSCRSCWMRRTFSVTE